MSGWQVLVLGLGQMAVQGCISTLGYVPAVRHFLASNHPACLGQVG